jgi:choline dehydrogenase-like flavoprotein
MFLDARKAQADEVHRAVVCVIGGGPAGLTLALEFERRGIDTIVLESGGFNPDAQSTDLLEGENVGIPYEFGEGMRSRFLGGGSNCWGGWCRPLESEDLQTRDWVPNSGWPFDRDALMPFYSRAHSILSLGPPNFEVDYWVNAIGRQDVRRMPLPSGRVIDNMSQFSKPTRFGRHFRRELKTARHVRVFLNANATTVETDPDGARVRQVEVRTLSGRRFFVQANQFVLAAGGIENARLLLSWNRQHRPGLGNANDLVGRYFMDHPRLVLHKVVFKPQWLRNKLYDTKFHYLNRLVAAHGTHVAAQMSIAPEVQRREGLLNGRLWFCSIFPGEGTPAADAIVRMKLRVHGKVDSRHSVGRDLALIAKQPWNSLNFVAARQMPNWAVKEMQFKLITQAQIQMICEPTPDPESRVTLSDRVDQLGMRRAKVNWKLSDQVKHTFDRSFRILAEELELAGIGSTSLEEPLLGRDWPASLEGTWHHMGTTRMHPSPRQGVVDPDCRIHGMNNMYVIGSSVFPTAGANFPTFTLVALSLRLADHLALLVKTPDASAQSASCEEALAAAV